VIHARPALADGFRVTGNGPVSRYIAYTPTGATKLISGAFQAGRLTLCNDAESQGRPDRSHQHYGRPRSRRIELASCP